MNDSISIGIMTFNEARCIERCIESIKYLADEIIIVDTGSTDGTKEIIKNMGIEKIAFYEKEWDDDFSEIRNFMLEKSTKDIVFQIDADEVLVTDYGVARDRIMKHLKADVILSVKITDFYGRVVSLKTPRIFRNTKGFYYYGKIHEQLKNNLNFEIKHSGIELLHDGYHSEIMENKKKSERNLRLLVEMMKQDNYILWNYYYIRDLMSFNQDSDIIYKEILQFLTKYRDTSNEFENEIYQKIEILKLYYDIFVIGNIDMDKFSELEKKYYNDIDFHFILLKLQNCNNDRQKSKIFPLLNNFTQQSLRSIFSTDATHIIQELFPMILSMDNEEIELLIDNSSEFVKQKMKERLKEVLCRIL